MILIDNEGRKTAKNNDKSYSLSNDFGKKRTDSHQDRELSPWSSEEFRSMKPIDRFNTIGFRNARINSMKKRFQQMHSLQIPKKRKSLELPNRPELSYNKISQDFFTILKVQKKKGLPQDFTLLRLAKIDMNLNSVQLDREVRKDQTQNFTKYYCFKTKEIPVQVRIAKKLKEEQQKEENIYIHQQEPLPNRVQLHLPLNISSTKQSSRINKKMKLRSPTTDAVTCNARFQSLQTNSKLPQTKEIQNQSFLEKKQYAGRTTYFKGSVHNIK